MKNKKISYLEVLKLSKKKNLLAYKSGADIEYASGLCELFVWCIDERREAHQKNIDLIKPTKAEQRKFYRSLSGHVPYWASGDETGNPHRRKLTPLRETLLLILAALNGEFD